MNESYGKAGLARNLLRASLAVDGFALFFALCAAVNNNGGGATLLLLFLAGITGAALWYATKQGYWFVRRIERTWKHVCAGLGGNFVGEGNDYLASVREGLRSGGKYDVPTQTKVIYPELRDVCGDFQAWTGLVRFFDGQTIDEYNDHADAFALAYQVPFVTFALDEDSGLIRVRAGRVPVPEEYEYEEVEQPASVGSPWLRQAVPVVQAAGPSLSYERGLLKSVPMALDIDGRVWSMPIEETHLLIAARTGGGKGSWLWSLVLRLAPAWRAGLVQFWGLDPKRLELAIGREWWNYYADTDVAMVELLEQAVSEMFEVGNQLKGKARRFEPSQQTPLNVVVIDELGYLSSLLTDRKLQTRADNAIKTLLMQGRSNGYAVVGLVQDPRKSTVEYRDLFPIRIAGGLNEAKMVDLVLGEGMHDAGALCERIPLGRPGAGVAYVLDIEHDMKPRMVRAAWVSDATIRNALSGSVRAFAEAYEAADEPHQVYEQGYVPQLGFDGKPLGQSWFRVE